MLCGLTTPNNCPEQTDHRGRFITTYSGAKFYINECNIEDIPMYDIAHALSMNCRFNGHTKQFYSVAEHCLIVSLLVPQEHALTGLLHDISEAFVPDIPRPFKGAIHGFDQYEERILQKVAEAYDITWPFPPEVEHIDKNIVHDEAAVLFCEAPEWINAYTTVGAGPYIQPLEPGEARRMFVGRFTSLMYERMDRDQDTQAV